MTSMRRTAFAALLASLGALACSCGEPEKPKPVRPKPTQARQGTVTLSVIGTNDLHGQIERLPILAGFVHNLRAVREAEGGGVVLLDGGDMFQGTLESNIVEGSDIVKAYNEIGYTAAAIGNHEFDYGPEGPAVTAATIEEDPRGALKARAAEAWFPLLTSNIFDEKSRSRIKWPNMPASTLVDVAGVKVGIIGATTESTPFTTMPANFLGLIMMPAGAMITAEAKALREAGAQVILVAAHIGSMCDHFEKPTDLSSCKQDEELFKVISDLPSGLVDVIVAGHTHAGMAHRVNDIAVIESYSSGRAFGRVDLRIAPDGHVTASKILPPQPMCGAEIEDALVPIAQCTPPVYEGKPVIADKVVLGIANVALKRAGERRSEKLGVTLTGPITKSYGSESAEGNLFTDLMLVAQPGTHVAVTNGGGLRADMPAGELTYGQLFEAMPFDNRFAIVDVKGSHLRKLVSGNLQRGGGILSWSGLTAKARCKGSAIDLAITVGGKPLDEAKSYKLVTSDFLASGGDGLIGRLKLPEGSVELKNEIIRDSMADILRSWKGTARATVDPAKLYSSSARRLDFEGERPVRCGSAGNSEPRSRDPED